MHNTHPKHNHQKTTTPSLNNIKENGGNCKEIVSPIRGSPYVNTSAYLHLPSSSINFLNQLLTAAHQSWRREGSNTWLTNATHAPCLSAVGVFGCLYYRMITGTSPAWLSGWRARAPQILKQREQQVLFRRGLISAPHDILERREKGEGKEREVGGELS